jgi:chaperonin GroEL
MVVKQVYSKEEGQAKLREGIRIAEEAVCSTLGPLGRTVLIESENHVGGVTITKDGITVLRSINLLDPVENLAVNIIRQASERTATAAGDGTSSTICLARGIIDEADVYVGEEDNMNDIIRDINALAEQIDKNLTKKSRKVTGKTLLDVATISANNDKNIGSIIADVYNNVDYVTVEKSSTTKTYTEVINGIRIPRGYTSKFFVNDFKKNECILEDAYVFITDHEINNLQVLENILKPIIQSGKPLLIIGEIDIRTLATINVNVQRGHLKCANIIPPSFGYKREELLSDLAVALGGIYHSEKTGDNLENVTIESMGRAAKVVVGQDSTVIIREKNEDVDARVNEHISQLNESKSLLTDANDIAFIEERISSIAGGVGIIKVGANTDIEQQELYDRVEDAVLAVKSAIEEGILPGGGIALLDESRELNANQSTAARILSAALLCPIYTILDNGGIESHIVMDEIRKSNKKNFGYNAKTRQFGDMYKMGVIDPAKVTKQALKNAVSVATTILSTSSVISNIRDYEGTK